MKPEHRRRLSSAGRAAILAVVSAACLALYVLLLLSVGRSFAALCIPPIAVGGLLYGLRGSVIVGPAVGAAFLLAEWLWLLPRGVVPADVAVVVVAVAVGGVIGRLRDLRKRLGEILGKTTAVESVLWHINTELTSINEQLERDRKAARRIQQSLIPDSSTKVPGLRAEWFFEPSEEVGGDLFNLFRIDERHAALYILDVSGHGVPAAFYTIGLSRALSPQTCGGSLVKRLSSGGAGYTLEAPAEVARSLNAQFQQGEEQEQYFTLIYGLLDLRSLELDYVVAGHPAPVWSPARGPASLLAEPSFPVGVEPAAEYAQRRIGLRPGDRIYLYTDGLPEMLDGKERCFGYDRLVAAISEARGQELGDVLASIRRRLDEFRGEEPVRDDVAMLGIEIGTEPALGR